VSEAEEGDLDQQHNTGPAPAVAERIQKGGQLREDPAISRIPLGRDSPRLLDDDDLPGADRVIRPDPCLDRLIEEDGELTAHRVRGVRVGLRDLRDDPLDILDAHPGHRDAPDPGDDEPHNTAPLLLDPCQAQAGGQEAPVPCQGEP